MKRKLPESKPQLFIIADEIWQNSSIDDITATVDDMSEMDIFYPPCNHFEVLIKAESLPHFFEAHTDKKLTEEEFNNHYKNQYYRIEIVIDDMEDWMKKCRGELMYIEKRSGQWIGASWLNNKKLAEGVITHAAWERENRARENTINLVVNLLLVTLATKNVERKSKPILMAKQALRSKALKRDYEYTTSLTIGKVDGAERTDGDLGGWKVRPHLRRGHVRDQRYGPNNQLLKKVFIQPVFVNAADGIVDQRRAYNVRLATGAA